MKQNKFWLKLIGVALLLHIVLIVISILEVAIYSNLINPGKGKAFYSAHATVSAPWVSAIFGSLFMFLLVKRFIKRFSQQHLAYTIWLPVIYIVIDFLLFFGSGYELKDLDYQFFLAKSVKIIAAWLAYFLYSKGYQHSKKNSGFI